MRESDVQRLVRERLGLRVGPEMAAYLLKRLGVGGGGNAGDASGAIPVIGGDARTGAAVRRELAPAELRAAFAGGAGPA